MLIERICAVSGTTNILSGSNIFEAVMALIITALYLTACVIVLVMFVVIGWLIAAIVKKIFLRGFGK